MSCDLNSLFPPNSSVKSVIHTNGGGKKKTFLKFRHTCPAVFGVGEVISYQFLEEEQACLVVVAP